jgi:hypothetical protein
LASEFAFRWEVADASGLNGTAYGWTQIFGDSWLAVNSPLPFNPWPTYTLLTWDTQIGGSDLVPVQVRQIPEDHPKWPYGLTVRSVR